MPTTPRVRTGRPTLTPPISRPVDDVAALEVSLAIDKLDLDAILEREGNDNFKIAEAYELAISRRDAAKQAAAEAEAEADLSIRRQAEAAQQKITEGHVLAMKVLNPVVREARRYELDLSLRAGRLRALRDSFERRSKAVSTLAELYKSGYFSGATRHHAQEQVRQAAADEARAQMARARREAGL